MERVYALVMHSRLFSYYSGMAINNLQQAVFEITQKWLLEDLSEEQKAFLCTPWLNQVDPNGYGTAEEPPFIRYLIEKACWDGMQADTVATSIGLPPAKKNRFGKTDEQISVLFEEIGIMWREKRIAELVYKNDMLIFSIEIGVR